MNKFAENAFWNEFGIYLLLAIVIYILPFAFSIYRENSRDDRFYQRISQISETCVEKANRDNLSQEICFEIQKSTETAYFAATSNSFFPMLILQGLLYGLACGIVGLRRQIGDLKEHMKELKQHLDA